MKGQILIIEDDEVLRKSIKIILEKEGYEVDVAGDSQSAFQLVQEKKYGLVVTDVRLPGGMDGVQILAKIKESWNGDFGMMVMTGFSDCDVETRARELGVGDYLHKPFKLDYFLDCLEKNIKRPT